jgi:ribonuclease J
MTQRARFKNDKLYFFPLGGANEIGMNLNVYVYDGQFLLVDMGITFEKLPGAEVVMPHLSILEEVRSKIAGIVLTHAHEDHIGALPYLWPYLKCPIFATPFTAGIIAHKFRERKIQKTITQLPLGSTWTVGPFDLEFVNLTHSIPEPNALVIKTPVGTIFHTGDWKLDAHPVIGNATDEPKIKALGKKGVLAMVCDSTSIFEEGWSGSEQSVQDFLVDFIQKFPENRVVVTCFASNVARLRSCVEAARASKRQIGLLGRSLERMSEVARSCGYFQDIPPFLGEAELKDLQPSKTLIVCTGSQGEDRAALMRLAKGTHPRLKLDPGDMVIFSSRIIPGNERTIFDLQNTLTTNGMQIITHKDHPDVHVSGHPSQEEMRTLYGWVKPKIAIPVHGEPRHLKAHASFAKGLGIRHTVIPQNGDVFELSANEGAKKVRELFTGRLALDGERLIPVDGTILKERSKLSELGSVFVSCCIKKKTGSPHFKVSCFGVKEVEDQQIFLKDLENFLVQEWRQFSEAEREDLPCIEKELVFLVKKFCVHNFGKKPMVFVQALYA